MDVVKGIGFGILNETLFLPLFSLQHAPDKEQAEGVDKVPACFLMLQFNADALRFEPRFRANQSDDRVTQPNESRLPIGSDERSQRQAEDHIGASIQRCIRVGFAASSRRVVGSGWAFDQPGRFGIERELPTGMMREPWAQPVAMFLHERKSFPGGTSGGKERLSKEGSDGPLAFIAFLGVDARFKYSEPVASASPSSRGRWRPISYGLFVNILTLLN